MRELHGTPQETIRYPAFGEELITSHLSPWRFFSKRFAPETGLLYFGSATIYPRAGGHAFKKHAAEFGFKTPQEVSLHIENVMTNPMTSSLSSGRTAYWDSTRYSSNSKP